jgi:hypothetical protein
MTRTEIEQMPYPHLMLLRLARIKSNEEIRKVQEEAAKKK